jgi:hypothetical protein
MVDGRLVAEAGNKSLSQPSGGVPSVAKLQIRGRVSPVVEDMFPTMSGGLWVMRMKESPRGWKVDD